MLHLLVALVVIAVLFVPLRFLWRLGSKKAS